MAAETIIIIGNLDGVHRGHHHLLKVARDEAGPDGQVVVLSFDPHPISVLAPPRTPARLSRFQRREEWLLEGGADRVERLEPTSDLLGMAPDDFVRWVVREHRPTAFVEGPDFRFGRDRAGSVETLRALGDELGFRTVVIDPIDVTLSDQHVAQVSSTLVRWLVARGRVRDAAAALGRPFELSGEVVSGDKRGREIGIPTMNLDHGELLLPADGIYAGLGEMPDGSTYPAAISVGTKPTFGTSARVCEAHLIGYDGPVDHYGWTLRLDFTAWVRDQVAFGSLDALIEQIHRDLAMVEQLQATASV